MRKRNDPDPYLMDPDPGGPESCGSVSSTSVADPDPGFGAFLTPGSGIGFFRISYPGSKPIFLTIFWVKTEVL
jgi:hypothetical protein